jgi:glutamate racemase
MHLLITDSGLGGLSICAATEKALRLAGGDGPVRITYFNAWPEQASGYNDLPEIGSRARALDRALSGMAAMRPDQIVIACNTLSIVYGHTAFSHVTAVPVLGIVDAGVEVFSEALTADPSSAIALFGTRTTIESGAHREKLIAKGIASRRIISVACHGLAKAIETDPDGDAIAGFIDKCTTTAWRAAPPRNPLYLGVCCTHFTYVADQMRAALEGRCGRPVQALDPGARLVAEVLRRTERAREQGRAFAAPAAEESRPRSVTVSVVSKVEMDDPKRRAMARRIEAASPATAAALLSYTRVPDLF